MLNEKSGKNTKNQLLIKKCLEINSATKTYMKWHKKRIF